MKKQHLITSIAIIVIVLLALFIYKNLTTKSIINQSNPVIKTDSKSILCGRDVSSYLSGKTYKNISNNRSVIFYDSVSLAYKLELFDGCKMESIVIFDNNDKENPQFGNKYFIISDKYFINLALNYEQNYKKVFFVDLQNVNFTDYLSNEYSTIDLNLADNETLLHYQYSCGDGCDSETRIFSATTTEDSIKIDVFDTNKKHDLILSNGIKVKANTKVRTIMLDVSRFEK